MSKFDDHVFACVPLFGRRRATVVTFIARSMDAKRNFEVNQATVDAALDRLRDAGHVRVHLGYWSQTGMPA